MVANDIKEAMPQNNTYIICSLKCSGGGEVKTIKVLKIEVLQVPTYRKSSKSKGVTAKDRRKAQAASKAMKHILNS